LDCFISVEYRLWNRLNNLLFILLAADIMASENNDDDIGGGSNESGEAPLWTYMTKKTKQGAKGRSWSFKCNICGETKSGSYSRVRANLLGIKNAGIAPCKKVTRCERLNMQRLEDEFEKKKSESGARAVPLPWETSSVASSAFKKRKSSISPLERAFGIEVRDQLDQEIARMFYTGGLPFNLAGNPHYQRSFQFATDNKIDDYVLPGYNKLRTTLLHKERDHVEQLLEPVKLSWKEKGVSIVSDGWSDPTRKPLINFFATSENGPLFLKAVNCFGEVKDKFFISDLMKDVLNEVGHQNVAQIITVNATNCKAAGEIIECTYPHIYWTPCVVHTHNLVLKNICAAKNVEGDAIG